MYLIATILAALIGLLGLQAISAQGLYGSSVVNVTDPTTASVPGAKVKITHVDSNQIRETQTNIDGTYSFPTIPPGTYEVEISREGFQTVTRRDIPVTMNTTVRVDAAKQVGAASESVEVTGQAALVQTYRAGVRSEFTTNSLTSLRRPASPSCRNRRKYLKHGSWTA